MLKHIKICLLSFVLITPATFAMLPDLGFSAATCCIYLTGGCLCCSSGINTGCKIHEYNKLSGDIAEIKDGISRINRNLTTPQIQKMTPTNLSKDTPPSLCKLKNTVDQSSMAGISCLTPPIPRNSLDGKKPQTPPLLKESE